MDIETALKMAVPVIAMGHVTGTNHRLMITATAEINT